MLFTHAFTFYSCIDEYTEVIYWIIPVEGMEQIIRIIYILLDCQVGKKIYGNNKGKWIAIWTDQNSLSSFMIKAGISLLRLGISLPPYRRDF